MSTKFEGELLFNCTVWNHHLAYLDSIIKEGIFINLELNSTFDGVQWDGNDLVLRNEDTHNLCEAINLVTDLMRARIPDFQFKGILKAQDHDTGDTWEVHIAKDGTAFRVNTPITGVISCPDCGHQFIK